MGRKERMPTHVRRHRVACGDRLWLGKHESFNSILTARVLSKQLVETTLIQTLVYSDSYTVLRSTFDRGQVESKESL